VEIRETTTGAAGGRQGPRCTESAAYRQEAQAPRPALDQKTKCPEIDCLRDQLAPELLQWAELRAGHIGVGADEVLIAAEAITQDAYVRALASALELQFDGLESLRRHDCPATDAQLLQSARAGLLIVKKRGELILIVAPRGIRVRQLIDHLRAFPHIKRRVWLTSTDCLYRFISRNADDALGAYAVEKLQHTCSAMSVQGLRPLSTIFALLAGALIALILENATSAVLSTACFALTALFVCWAGLRWLASSFLVRSSPIKRVPNNRLPIYSIIIALYDESAMVERLLRTLRNLDYPAEKLDIKFVVEADDWATSAALQRCASRLPFEMIIAPLHGPRTKPKALNAAMPFVRGSFVAVFDAEDQIEPGQLREALHAFARDATLACVQARLTVDNTKANWLTKMFTAEYAGLFDAVLPGLSRWRLPLPLGGSSNHFRTSVLEALGGWDAFNVTEDADLGIRLARHGHRTAVITASTYEEAPEDFKQWLRQRTRWFKGWMQTWLVHSRHPVRLARELGVAGFLTFQLVAGGTVLSALVHPLFFLLAAVYLVSVIAQAAATNQFSALLDIRILVVTCGYIGSALPALIGLYRRRLTKHAWVLLGIPLHWLMLSIAAWRGLIQLVRNPYKWEKTQHGRATTSRLRDMRGQKSLTGKYRASSASWPY
jgi:cellulose synthase/poly-beta-1,6-N-acetylglucosamine synthase-like glycosyltransferase